MALTTKDVAAAAGVAEGTIFRAFESKDELVMEAIQAAFHPGEFLGELDAIDRELPLRERLTELLRLTQDRFRSSFSLMRAIGMMGPPRAEHNREWQPKIYRGMADVLAPSADGLRLPPAQVACICRMLAFASENPHFTDDFEYTPELLASILLDGVLTTTDKERACC